MKRFAAILAACCLTMGAAQAERVIEDEISTQYENIRLVEVVGGLEHPWAVAFLPDGSKLITERPGRLQHLQDGELTEIHGVPEVVAINQGGMMDVSLHPDFEENGWVYLTYSKGDHNETATTLVRGRVEGDQFVDMEEIFTQDRKSSPGRHYGSRLAWTGNGLLLMSVGDRGADPPRAQDLGDHAGALLRMHDDGTPPVDNPFVDTPGAHPEIYSYGHRNIQGIVVHPMTGEIWTNEHGPRGGDRLDLVKPGNNYGWPIVSYGRVYRTEDQWGAGREAEGFEPPLYEFLPTIAPAGMALVTSRTFPNWQGNLLVPGLAPEHIRRVVVENYTVVHEEELLRGKIGRIRDVREGPDGHLYVLNDEEDGSLFRIEPAS